MDIEDNEIILGIASIFIIIAICVSIYMLISWSFRNMASDLADIQKCQRLTNMGFWECEQMSKEDINNLQEKGEL